MLDFDSKLRLVTMLVSRCCIMFDFDSKLRLVTGQ